MVINKSVPFHFSKLLGQSRAVQVQVIGQLLSVKGNGELIAVLFDGDGV